MSASEALVETLVKHRVDRVFGIVGSAFIDPLDLFPSAGIRFVDVQHEQNAVHMADAYARQTGRHGVVMGQNGPGISNMVTGVATAFMSHSPVTLISPQSGSDSVGKLGFQEIDQMPMFSNVTKYQAHVPNSARIPEIVGRALNVATQTMGPTQVNIPRDMFYDVHDYAEIRPPTERVWEVPCEDDVARIADMLTKANRPMIVAGYGCRDVDPIRRLAERLSCPVATTYLHNDVYPSTDPHFVGSLGYMGSQAAMHSVRDSDCILALGTRLNPFGTTAQYGIEYWDPSKALIQVDRNPGALGVSCSPDLAVCADAAETAAAIDRSLVGGRPTPLSGECGSIPFGEYKRRWASELEDSSVQPSDHDALRPKAVLRALALEMKRMRDPVVTTDIGHCCSQALSYLEFSKPRSLLTAGTFGACGTAIPFALGARLADPERPVIALVGDGAVNMQGINECLTSMRYRLGVTIVVFRNNVWGAELLNQLIWTDARAVGTVISNPPIHKTAQAFGCEGVEVWTLDGFAKELRLSVDRQSEGRTTLIEVHCDAEMGAPFRSDAMRCPERLLPKYAHLTTKEARYGRQWEGRTETGDE
jgi:sulfoacetaldehyde acetyltransferase